MSDTTFVNGVTLSDADWFNDLNRLHYSILGDPADAAAVKVVLHPSPGPIGSVTPNTGAFTQMVVLNTTTALAGDFTSTFATESVFRLGAAINRGTDNSPEVKWSWDIGGTSADHFIGITDRKAGVRRFRWEPHTGQSVLNAGTWDFFGPAASSSYFVTINSTTNGQDRWAVVFVLTNADGSIRIHVLGKDADIDITAVGASLRLTNSTGLTQAFVASIDKRS